MKKAYWIAPIIVLLAFIGLYASSRHELQQKKLDEEAAQAKVREEKKERARVLQEAAAKKRAEDVAAANAKRKADEERAQKEKEMFEQLNYQRNFANSEAERLKRVVDDIKKDIDSEVEARKKAEETIAKLKDEKVFLAGYSSKADLNVKNLQSVLTKIEEVDRAVAKAKEDAAKAAAEKKS